MKVRNQDGSPVTPEVELWAVLADSLGIYEADFTHMDGVLIDAECEMIPPLSELLLLNPALTGIAITWLAQRLNSK